MLNRPDGVLVCERRTAPVNRTGKRIAKSVPKAKWGIWSEKGECKTLEKIEGSDEKFFAGMRRGKIPNSSSEPNHADTLSGLLTRCRRFMAYISCISSVEFARNVYSAPLPGDHRQAFEGTGQLEGNILFNERARFDLATEIAL